MRKLQWLIAIISILTGIFLFSFPLNGTDKELRPIVLPDDYDQLKVAARGTVSCTQNESFSAGMADLLVYPDPKSPKNYIIITSNTCLTDGDLGKSDEELRDKMALLSPYALFHLQVLDNKQVKISSFMREGDMWLEALKLWQTRFDMNWELVDTQTRNAGQNDNVGDKMLEDIYKMSCKLSVGTIH